MSLLSTHLGHHNNFPFGTLLEIERKSQSTEPFIASYLNNFLSTLLVVPVGGYHSDVSRDPFCFKPSPMQDNPDLEALYLLRGLLNAVQEYQW